MNVLMALVLAIAGVGLMVAVVFGWVVWQVMRPPPNHPGQFALERLRKNRPEKVVVCAGDSLTHGTLSYPYVQLLQQRLGRDGFFFVNAGVNGDLAFNLGRRLEPIIACQPDFITILIGTNDVNATLSEGNLKRYITSNQLPEAPTLDTYGRELETLLKTLQSKTSARIAVLSPPILAERLLVEPNRTVARYAAKAAEIARKNGVTYLPLFELMCEELHQEGHVPTLGYQDGVRFIARMGFRQYLLRKDYDTLSAENGYYFLTDGIHLNSRAGKRIAGLIEDFLFQGK